ncbi:MAG: HEAT repeat domain-containing protein [Rhodanobacter sp.]|nr:MAG: HEAT repeat domain-containing protein [Rhodanobacter sp.]
MTTFFCPHCFAEIEPTSLVCPLCGIDIVQWRAHPYKKRLVHALGHPLADVRMISIEALGRLGDPDAAMPLVQCALARPVDVTQGLAIVSALATLRRDESWADAVRLLRDHPARAVARAATELLPCS